MRFDSNCSCVIRHASLFYASALHIHGFGPTRTTSCKMCPLTQSEAQCTPSPNPTPKVIPCPCHRGTGMNLVARGHMLAKIATRCDLLWEEKGFPCLHSPMVGRFDEDPRGLFHEVSERGTDAWKGSSIFATHTRVNRRPHKAAQSSMNQDSALRRTYCVRFWPRVARRCD